VQNALIFCNRKRDVDILYKSLSRHRFSVGALHGDMAQTVRFATLEKFKAGELQLLVCSDVAARGLDIGGLSHVFNFDVPHHAEDYVHRIGRTGRAGLEGHAFTIASPGDRYAVEAIEKLVGHAIPPVNVEGLDPVAWAEEDGGKRRRARGKGRVKEEPRAEGRKRDKGKKETSEAKRPRERAKTEAVVGPAPPPLVGLDREADQGRGERTSRTAPSRRPPSPILGPLRGPGPQGEAEQHASRRRPPRREAHHSDDHAPAVRGFGDDVPAFMLLRPRPRPVAKTEHQESEA